MSMSRSTHRRRQTQLERILAVAPQGTSLETGSGKHAAGRAFAFLFVRPCVCACAFTPMSTPPHAHSLTSAQSRLHTLTTAHVRSVTSAHAHVRSRPLSHVCTRSRPLTSAQSRLHSLTSAHVRSVTSAHVCTRPLTSAPLSAKMVPLCWIPHVSYVRYGLEAMYVGEIKQWEVVGWTIQVATHALSASRSNI
jgi:hypothetical protein